MDCQYDKVSDNYYKMCPLKSDYSPFTNWKPRCATEYQDMIANKLPSSLDYRMFLTQNAEKIMKYNTEQAYIKNNCGPCKDSPSWNDGTMLREFDVQTCNSRTCSFRSGDPWGLGRHRQYYDDEFDNDVNKKYIAMKEKENEWFKLNKDKCLGTINDNFNVYPIEGISDDFQRTTVPGGYQF